MLIFGLVWFLFLPLQILDYKNGLCCTAIAALYPESLKQDTEDRLSHSSFHWTTVTGFFTCFFFLDTGMHGRLLISNPASAGEMKKPPACRTAIRALSRKAIIPSGTVQQTSLLKSRILRISCF